MDTESAPAVIAARYEVIRSLGRGSFGRTFLARDVASGKEVALKLFDLRASADWKAVELFEREAAVLRSLRHQGVPTVYDTFRADWDGSAAAFLVMEYIAGTSLAQMIEAKQSLGQAEVLNLFLELLGILDYLHTRTPPILHRDIKPANIIVRPDGQPALVDFGSVRHIHLDPHEAGSTIAGTYGYMPYEQYMGQATPSSDLFALGATFLHLVTGRPPRDFMGADGRISVPTELPGDTRLQPIITRMLHPAPAERFAAARAVRDALLAPTAINGRAQPPLPAGRPSAAAALPPAPRIIDGATAELYKRVAPTMWKLMDGSSKPSGPPGVVDWAIVAFFSILTAGVLPAVFYSMMRAERRRLQRFFREGVYATAEIRKIDLESTAFGEKLARISYEFVADDAMHRDSDRVLPVIAGKWMPGDTIEILYLRDDGYDSAIISTS